MKTYKLVALGILAFSGSSAAHYLLTILDSKSLKLLGYGSVLTIATMSVVLDDAIADYLQLQGKGIIAIFATIATAIFLGGSYRAFAMNQQLEGYLLVTLISGFWLLLLAIYVRILLINQGGNQ